MRVLIAGGAAFLGSQVAHELLAPGHAVCALDSLIDQVHDGGRPAYLAPEVELMEGDVRDAEAVARALEGCGAVAQWQS